jgi:hypothetical protein
MAWLEAGVFPAMSDVFNLNWFFGYAGKSKRASEYLPTSLSKRTIDFEHLHDCDLGIIV